VIRNFPPSFVHRRACVKKRKERKKKKKKKICRGEKGREREKKGTPCLPCPPFHNIILSLFPGIVTRREREEGKRGKKENEQGKKEENGGKRHLGLPSPSSSFFLADVLLGEKKRTSKKKEDEAAPLPSLISSLNRAHLQGVGGGGRKKGRDGWFTYFPSLSSHLPIRN